MKIFKKEVKSTSLIYAFKIKKKVEINLKSNFYFPKLPKEDVNNTRDGFSS